MRMTALFFAYLFACFLLAALLTYPLMATGWIAIDAHRVMGRLAQVFILAGLWPLLAFLRLDDRAALGYRPTGAFMLRRIGLGWLVGLAILGALVAVLMTLEIRVLDPGLVIWPGLVEKGIQALIGGLLIGVLEETFFRGALYTAIRGRDGVRSAVLWSSALYAVLHFMKPGALPDGMAFDWFGALWMFVHAFADLFQWKNLDSLVALFAVGVFLSLVRERSGHIGWCIGMHAGWVFAIQMTRRVSDGNPASDLGFLVGDYDGTIGWLAAAWIGSLAALFWWWRSSRPGDRADSASDGPRRGAGG
ncbi:CPBP family intramembrane glutamic endopeptidase [Thiorhodococcus fuscus]|uniref:CPBP family intramembrane glutamic endopeptidase n=1 Tax=Thiorhodococcus fuscus TaxID=527200 RepID=A0ABW4YCD1_9GAMM